MKIEMGGAVLNTKNLIAMMKKANAQWAEGHTEIEIFCEIYYTWIKFFLYFGKAIAFAFQDTIGKADTIKANPKSFVALKLIAADSNEAKFVQDYC